MCICYFAKNGNAAQIIIAICRVGFKEWNTHTHTNTLERQRQHEIERKLETDKE